MKKLTLIASLLIIIGLVFSSCTIIPKPRQRCPKKLFKNYQPRLQGGQKWNYKQHMGPKRKLAK